MVTKIFKDIYRKLSETTDKFNGRPAMDIIAVTKSGTGWTVPDGVGFCTLTAAAAQGSLTLPTTGSAGQLLFVYNADDAATTAVEIAATKTAMFVHNGTAWVEVAEQS